MRSSNERDLVPHEVGQLHEEDLVGVEVVERRRAASWPRSVWNESMPRPRLGASARLTTSQAVVNSLTVRPQRQALVGDLDAQRHRQHRELAQVARQRIEVVAWHACEVDEQTSSSGAPTARAHLEHRLGDVDLVVVQVAGEAFEVAQHLEAGDAQAAGLDHAHRGVRRRRGGPSGRWPEHHLAEAGLAHRAQLVGQRARSVIVSMPKSSMNPVAWVIARSRRCRCAPARTSRRRASSW